MLQKMLLIIFFLYANTGAAYIPSECQPDNYQVLTETARLFNSSISIPSVDDQNLAEGWYRFDGEGKELKVAIEDFSTSFLLKETFHPCGTHLTEDSSQITTSELYVMKQSHPKAADGIVQNSIDICHYTALKSSCTGSGDAAKCIWMSSCTREIDLHVRNCGEFFVYYLQPTTAGGAYCTEKTISQTEVSPRLECQHYGNLTDASRFWDANIIPGRDVGRTCQDSLFTKQWTRFLSQNGTDAVLADNCPSVITDIAGYMDRPPCGAMYRGWIKGSHPTEEGELVKRPLCFSSPTTCECQASSEISIINCGNFHIYKRTTFPVCTARACTVLKQQGFEPTMESPTDIPSQYKDFCSSKTTIEDDTRFWSTIEPSHSKCDAKFRQGVSFTSSEGDNLKLKEGCNIDGPVFPVGRCSSKGAMWLDGAHPGVEMGIVPRYVCIHKPNGYPSSGKYDICECTIRRPIRVQNCTTYFAYELDPVEDCIGRYCLEHQDTSAPRPTAEPLKITESCPEEEKEVIPMECRAENYNVLSNPDRLHDNNIRAFADDSLLSTGWYRFGGMSQQLQEGLPNDPDMFLPNTFSVCGSQSTIEQTINGAFFVTSNLYALKQPHPKVRDGLVKRDVQICRYEAQFFGRDVQKSCRPTPNGYFCFWNLKCRETFPIYVRNCGDFHVYHLKQTNARTFLSKGGVYCSSRTRTQTEGPLRLECQNYVNVTDNSRFWNSNQTSGSDINTQLQDSLFTKDWTRFLGSNSTNVFDAVIPDKCISVLTETSGFMDRSPCGAIYRGWMHNSHPAVTNELKKSKLCFSHPTTCECQSSTDINVINCGKFFIYKRNDFPLGQSRACTVPQDAVDNKGKTKHVGSATSIDLCSHYQTVIDDSRFWSSTDQSSQQCDGGFKHPVRFMSSKGEYLKLHEGCNSSGPIFPIGKCQSNTVTWIDGKHPNETEGPVVRSLCIHHPGYPFFGNYLPCQCQFKQNVLVQKCSNFFAYKLDGFSNCDIIRSRYCLQNTGDFKPICNGKWHSWSWCSKEGIRTRSCYEIKKTPITHTYNGKTYTIYRYSYIKTNITETEDCQYVCELSRYRYSSCVVDLSNVKKSNGEFILPYQNYPTSGQTTGMFSSITLTKKREKEVICFNYRYQGIQGKVNFSVSEINVNTNVITKRFNPNFLSEVQTRHCFMISNSLSEGDQYQIVFKAVSLHPDTSNLVYIDSYSLETRNDVPCDKGTNFHARRVLCTSGNKTPFCVVEKTKASSSNIDWVWDKNGYIQLKGNATISHASSTLQFNKPLSRKHYCFCIDVNAQILNQHTSYSNYKSKMTINQVSGSSTKIIGRVHLFNHRLYRCFDVPTAAGCSKIEIYTEITDWSDEKFIRLHEVKLRNERCDHVPHGYTHF